MGSGGATIETASAFPDFVATPANATRGYELLLETVDLNVDMAWQYMMRVVTSWRPWMRRAMGGARLVCAGATITGRPGRLVHLWRVREGFSTAKMFAALSAHAATPEGAWVGPFTEHLHRVSYDLLVPTGYDPARSWPDDPAEGFAGPLPAAPTGERPVRLIDVIDVKPGRLSALAEVKRGQFVPRAAELGVHLMASATSATGLGRRLVQVWELPHADALLRAMRRFSEVAWYQKMLRDNVASEQQELLHPLAWYDPHPALVTDASDPTKRCWRYGT